MSWVRWMLNYGRGPWSKWHELRAEFDGQYRWRPLPYCGSRYDQSGRLQHVAILPAEALLLSTSVCGRCRQVKLQHERGLVRPDRARRAS